MFGQDLSNIGICFRTIEFDKIGLIEYPKTMSMIILKAVLIELLGTIKGFFDVLDRFFFLTANEVRVEYFFK